MDDHLSNEMDMHVNSMQVPGFPKNPTAKPKAKQPQLINIEDTIPRVPVAAHLPPIAQHPAATAKSRAMNKELSILLERQRLFKEAALMAKKEGNTSVALVYLRNARVNKNSAFLH
jgi:LAS superfamily LD-carboxypeptidase LdcB